MFENGNYHGRRGCEELIKAIDESYVAEAKRKHPKFIKPSSIGQECKRASMLDFLWASPIPAKPARILRIFGTGHRIEEALIGDLKRAGWEVMDRDPYDARRQISLSAVHGHLFGFVDGIGRDREVNGEWCVIECKSHKADSFRKVVKHGVAAAKPEHYAQMQLYMGQFKLKLGLYQAKNKNEDLPKGQNDETASDLHFEWVEFDEAYYARLLEEAELIASKEVIPPRISQVPTHFKCKMCDHSKVCHEGVAPLRNCRTCARSKPLDGGVWACQKFNCLIEKDLMLTGCADYELWEALAPLPMTEAAE
jgi:hypothetical protein